VTGFGQVSAGIKSTSNAVFGGVQLSAGGRWPIIPIKNNPASPQPPHTWWEKNANVIIAIASAVTAIVSLIGIAVQVFAGR
jgi:hypothetical protein